MIDKTFTEHKAELVEYLSAEAHERGYNIQGKVLTLAEWEVHYGNMSIYQLEEEAEFFSRSG